MRDKKHLILLYNQLSTLLASDISLAEAIAIVAEDGDNNKAQRTVVAVNNQLNGGADIVSALRGQSAVFPEIVIALVQKECSGKQLAALFTGLSEELDSDGSVKKRLLYSLLYPGAVLLIAVLLIFLMLTFVIPVFAEVYEGFGMSLPYPTLLLLNASSFLGSYWFYFVLALVAGGGVCCFKSDIVLQICARLPVTGTVLNNLSLFFFSRYLAVLCGFDLTAQEMTRYAVERIINPSLHHQIRTVADQAADQQRLAVVLSQCKALPPLFQQMIRVGEKSSSLAYSLKSLAVFYEKEAKRASRRLIVVVDILAIILVAFLVSSFVFAMYMPLFSMASVVG